MATETYLTNLPLGAIQHGPRQFIKQLVVENGDAAFELVLPGQITHCEGASSLSILPYGRIVLTGGSPPRSATVSADVSDEPGLTQALCALAAKLKTQEYGGFAVRLASQRHSFADIVERAEESVGSCGCESADDRGSVLASISVGLSDRSGKKLTWCDPVSAIIKGWSGDHDKYSRLNPKAGAVAYVFTCHSVWSGIINRRTDCEGSCSGTKTCTCGKTAAGTPKTVCFGEWKTCWCI